MVETIRQENNKFWKIVPNIPAVSVRDALVFVGVEPDLIFAAFHNGRREALLQDESRHNDLKQIKSDMKKLNFWSRQFVVQSQIPDQSRRSRRIATQVVRDK